MPISAELWGNPQRLKEWVEIIESALKSLGILAAGGWAYFNFFRGRTYTPRLKLRVSGEILYGARAQCILIATEVENLGLSKVTINQVGSGIRILGYRDASGFQVAEHLDTFPIFEAHEWIEPTEMIGGETLVDVPHDDWLAFRLEMRLVSQGKSWTASTTIPIRKEISNGEEQRSSR